MARRGLPLILVIMRRHLSLHVVLVVTAAVLALVLTVSKRTHQGIPGVAFAPQQVGAAPAPPPPRATS